MSIDFGGGFGVRFGVGLELFWCWFWFCVSVGLGLLLTLVWEAVLALVWDYFGIGFGVEFVDSSGVVLELIEH